MKLGASFSESIHTEKISRRKFNSDSSYFSNRSYIFLLLLIFVAIILFGRLFFLQIILGQYYRNLSDSNRIRTKIIHASRGIIFDRNNKQLVFNVPGFREKIKGKTVLLSRSEALNKISQGDKNLEVDSLRDYSLGETAPHLIGYIGQISAQELGESEFYSYQPDALIGETGIERQYNSILTGVDGKTLEEVDATGKVIRTLGQVDPISGQNVTLTIDSNLQKDTAVAMKDVKKGAAIISSPTGEILALVSKPNFDPNLFTMGNEYKSSGNYQSVEQIISDNNNRPLYNRAISGTYPPGSTFKLVTAAAGLESGKINENYLVDDTGVLKVGNFSFSNWYFSQNGKTEGQINVVTAIKRSNDIFFYTVGNLLGVDTLSSYAQKFGLGSPLGIDLPGEASGLIPTKEWKLKTVGEQWYLGDDYHYGIGQGFLLTTPLQVNAWTQAIANGGNLYQQHLLKDKGLAIKDKGLLSDKNFSLIREGMIEACSTGGVAWPLFGFKIQDSRFKIDGKNFLAVDGQPDQRQVVVACKTGTAQHGDETTTPHAWITLFAPAYNPQIVVTILVEDGGEGSNVAAPIAKEILTNWFEK